MFYHCAWMRWVLTVWVLCCLCGANAIGSGIQPASLDVIGVHQAQAAHPELTGRDVRVGLVELSRSEIPNEHELAFVPNFEHRALQNLSRGAIRCFVDDEPNQANSWHASLIAASLCGHDEQAWCPGIGETPYCGAVPEATLSVYETNYFLHRHILGRAAGENTPSINEDVLSISWGTDAEDLLSKLWGRGFDALVPAEQCVMVAAVGNGGDQFSAIHKPAGGFNIISVGSARALGMGPDRLRYVGAPLPEHSSSGPTPDGRCKPDLIAPGLLIGPQANSVSDYIDVPDGMGYSSFAAPQVAGAAAMLIDAARKRGWERATDPRVVKAILMNGANKLVGWHKGHCGSDDDRIMPLDLRQGAGLVDVRRSLEQLYAGRYRLYGQPNGAGWDLTQIALVGREEDTQRCYVLGDVKAGQTIRATLVWYRHYENDGLFSPQPLSVLTLSLWAMNDQGRMCELLDYSTSHTDNVQHIDYTCAQDGYVQLMVSAQASAIERERETFALAYTTQVQNWPGDLPDGDINGDGVVDVADLMCWARAAGYVETAARPTLAESPCDWRPEDFNADGCVDDADFQVLSRNWQRRAVWCYR